MIDFINSLHDVIFVLLVIACIPFQRYFYVKNKTISNFITLLIFIILFLWIVVKD